MLLHKLAVGLACWACIFHYMRAEYEWSLFNLAIVVVNTAFVIYRREGK